MEKFCENCGKVIPLERLNNKTNTCCRSCATILANKRRGKHTLETRQKISNNVKKYKINSDKDNFKLISECIDLGILCNYNNVEYVDRYININRCKINICPICGKEYPTYLKSYGRLINYSACSNKCLKIKSGRIIKEKAIQRIKDGTFSGWKSRNILSYPEKFWINVLTNNKIEFKTNFPFDKYFLDFYIETNNRKIDLEIDGKQHKYPDRLESDKIRDIFVTKNNIIVYRIEWNEINSENGKKLMEEKINKFLDFYKNI